MSSVSAHLNRAEARVRFFYIADQAIQAGVLTAKERDIICRRGHRKQGYWNRHLDDLLRILKDRDWQPPQ